MATTGPSKPENDVVKGNPPPPPRKKLPQDLQNIVDGANKDDRIYGEVWSGT
ncbi:hypothetical protein V497_06003, partial [Pseudogymnoascus sp. VKM F-4516 (FW-969)]